LAGVVGFGEVSVEDERPVWRVGVAPLGDPFEEAADGEQPASDGVAVQGAATEPGSTGQPGLVGLDVVSTDVGDADDIGCLAGQEAPELAERPFGIADRRGPQAELDLGQVTLGGRRQRRRHARPLRRSGHPGVRLAEPRRGVGHPGVEHRRLQPDEGGPQLVASLGVPGAGERSQQRRPTGVEMAGGDLVWCDTVEGGELGERVPLGGHPRVVRPEHLGGDGQALMNVAVVVGGDGAEPKIRPGQVLG